MSPLHAKEFDLATSFGQILIKIGLSCHRHEEEKPILTRGCLTSRTDKADYIPAKKQKSTRN